MERGDGIMKEDPRAIIAREPMTPAQWAAIAIIVVLNALDGFDVLSISYASPRIKTEWNIGDAQLGWVLAAELFGMAAGSLLLGSLADRIGRRPTQLGCLIVMAAGMALAATAHDMTSLMAYRVATGLGIGGMLAAINASAAEFSNAKYRDLAVAVMATGYPLGSIIGGTVSSMGLLGSEWRNIFWFGAAATAALIPPVFLFVPETVAWLAVNRPGNAVARINKVMRQLGHSQIDALPAAEAARPRVGVGQLFRGAMAVPTTLLTIAYFGHVITFYFIIKWIPKIVVSTGYSPPLAGSVLVWASVGGALGALLLSAATRKFAVKTLLLISLIGATAGVILFATGPKDLTGLSTIAAFAGFFTNAAIVGLYATLARIFPTAMRASGTGFVIGVGRGGSALAPVIAGYLFQWGFSLPAVSIILGMGSMIAFVMILLVKYHRDGDD
jgi:benzoate transport